MNKQELRSAGEQLERVIESAEHDGAHEVMVHRFFEENPVFLPNVFQLHNGPVGGAVISKPSLGDFIPDFAFAMSNSMEARTTVIEIEDPCKTIFTKSDQFTSEFNHALQQVRDWLGQVEMWKERFWHLLSTGLDRPNLQANWVSFSYRGVLVFGRRAELDSAKRKERWASIPAGPIDIMTYDRLLDFKSDPDYLARKLGDVDWKNPDGLQTVSYRDRTFVRLREEAAR